MSNRFLLSVFFGAVISGLAWVVLVPEKKERAEISAVESPLPSRGREGGLRTFPQDWRGLRVWETRDKMEVIESLEEVAFDELATMAEPELKKLAKGVVWSFPQWAIFGRMSEIDPKGTWEYLDTHFPEEAGVFSSFAELRPEILTNWISQDFEECLQFLDEIVEQGFQKSGLLGLLEVGSPRGWMTFYNLNADDYQYFSGNERFVSSLRDGAECREALEIWRDEMPVASREKWAEKMENAARKSDRERARKKLDPGLNPLVQNILQRWREVDEAGFLESDFVRWER